MSDEESSSYASGSNSESYESSSNEEVVLKPVFLSRNQRKSHENLQKSKQNDINRGIEEGRIDEKVISEIDRKKAIILNKAGHEVNTEKIDGNEFDGVDDADDVDPENEYEDWKIRENGRYKRDRERMAQEEQTKDEKVRRDNLTEEALIDDFKKRQKERESEFASIPNNYHKGAFFGDNENINNLLKRTYEHIGDDEDNDNTRDHSRPTKLRFN